MDRKNRYTKFIIVAFLLLGSISCNNWLDLEPENKLVQQEFWKKKEDVAAVMAAMYDAYRETSEELWIWGELRADMVEISGTAYSGYQQIALGSILPTNGKISWSEFYNAINLANTILVFADDVLELDETFEQKLEESYKAEAIFIRSKAYFDLIRIWKDVPLVLNASSTDTVSFSVPKNTEEEVIAQIEADLIMAKTTSYTNEYEYAPEMFKGRANTHSINALLADVYLWSEQYQKCIDACNEIIESGKFSLQDANTWFDLYYPGNARESIFELQYNDALENEENPFNNGLIPAVGSSKVLMKPYAQDLFSLGDIRVGNPDPRSKFQLKSITPKTKRTSDERDANMIMYRYADVLLMKAEALAELGQFPESNSLINEIIQRSTMPPVNFEPKIEPFRTAILEERAKEFACEGKRWFDILRFAKRNNFENKNLIIQMILEGADVKLKPILRSKVLDPMSYYLPIPQSELDRNPNLVQNPYYDR